jgi:hypothetical protein
VLDSPADLHEKFQPFSGREIIFVAKAGDFYTANQLHDEEWPTGIGRASIQHLGNIGVVHQRQGLALGLEAANDLFGIHAQLDDLERDAATDRFFLVRHVHDTATAFANLLQEFVAADVIAGLLWGRGSDAQRRACDRRADRRLRRSRGLAFQEGDRLLMNPEQGFEAQAEGRIIGASIGEIRHALAGG